MKTFEGNVTRAARRNAARKAGTLTEWRNRDRHAITKVVGVDAKGNKIVRGTQIVGAPN